MKSSMVAISAEWRVHDAIASFLNIGADTDQFQVVDDFANSRPDIGSTTGVTRIQHSRGI
jgi:hypothetical protein